MNRSDRDDIYEDANLTQHEIDAVERCLDEDCQDSEVEVSGFSKLQEHFCDTEEIPYAIVTQASWHPENTHTPDEWIVEHLKDV